MKSCSTLSATKETPTEQNSKTSIRRLKIDKWHPGSEAVLKIFTFLKSKEPKTQTHTKQTASTKRLDQAEKQEP